jgi:hypothetical protein
MSHLVNLFLNSIDRLQNSNASHVYGELQQLIFHTQQIALNTEFVSDLAKKLIDHLHSQFDSMLKADNKLTIAALLDPLQFNQVIVHQVETIGALFSHAQCNDKNIGNDDKQTSYNEWMSKQRQQVDSSVESDALIAEIKSYVRMVKKRSQHEDVGLRVFWTAKNVQTYVSVFWSF